MLLHHLSEGSHGPFGIIIIVLHQPNGHERTGGITAARIFFNHLLQAGNRRFVITHDEIGVWHLKSYIVRIIGIWELFNNSMQCTEFCRIVALQPLDDPPLEKCVVLALCFAIDQPVVVLHSPARSEEQTYVIMSLMR